eukprot:Hpha_TRINITY_DN16731_c1_g2::TRINITY_DN16731_c1_g2_i2::g.78056::m.78056
MKEISLRFLSLLRRLRLGGHSVPPALVLKASVLPRRTVVTHRRGEKADGAEVRVDVARGTAVLHVPLPVLLHVVPDTHARVTAADAPRELAQLRRLVRPSHALVVVTAVELDVLQEGLPEVFARLLDRRDTARNAHLLGAEVVVAARSVPVTLHRLRVVVDLDTVLLTDLLEHPTGHHHVVALVDAQARANLELPLRGRHLGVHARDLQAHPQARLVVLHHDITPHHLVAVTAVVVPLRLRETAGRPAQRLSVLVQEVLLLQTEPGLVGSVLLEVLHGNVTAVRRVRLHSRRERLAQHRLRVLKERVREHPHGLDQHLARVSLRLTSRRTVVVPHLHRLGRGLLDGQVGHSHVLGAQVSVRVGAAEEDVLRDPWARHFCLV